MGSVGMFVWPNMFSSLGVEQLAKRERSEHVCLVFLQVTNLCGEYMPIIIRIKWMFVGFTHLCYECNILKNIQTNIRKI